MCVCLVDCLKAQKEEAASIPSSVRDVQVVKGGRARDTARPAQTVLQTFGGAAAAAAERLHGSLMRTERFERREEVKGERERETRPVFLFL